ncbi:SRPBCC domain-containing protein [Phenylobacterium sp.]|uniref:SRPBCC family protein n=1 Tax=Phenylobacterium sp. TaxID=1871053 RepID=UPI002736426B|nr:SRPBCC domain-containing protein [Phenylobacterium sp.]MDP3658813.1 SRPBCC domain-containing protein [Phenylobacterium sp.]
MSDLATVHVSKRFEATPERVFDAWLDPALAGQFLFATPTGTMITVEIDPKVGGRFTFIEHRPEQGDIEHIGEYLAIERPRRLSFTFAVPEFSDAYTTVTVEIAPIGAGCGLTLTHEGVLPDYERQTAQGWTTILGALAKALGEATD